MVLKKLFSKTMEKGLLYLEYGRLALAEARPALKFIGKGLLNGRIIAHIDAVKSTYSFLPEFINFWNNYGSQKYINEHISCYRICKDDYPEIVDLNRLFRKMNVYPSSIIVEDRFGRVIESYYLVNRGTKQAQFVTRPSFAISLGYEDYLTYELIPEKHMLTNYDCSMKLIEHNDEIGFIA